MSKEEPHEARSERKREIDRGEAVVPPRASHVLALYSLFDRARGTHRNARPSSRGAWPVTEEKWRGKRRKGRKKRQKIEVLLAKKDDFAVTIL